VLIVRRLEFYEWDWAGADRELRRGMQLKRTVTHARILYANYLIAMGRFEESIAVGEQPVKQYKKGLELDPRFQD
jgi:hypothetical protein